MMSGNFKFQICFQFNGTVEIKADSKKKALEAIKELRARISDIKSCDDRIKDWNVEMFTEAEERI